MKKKEKDTEAMTAITLKQNPTQPAPTQTFRPSLMEDFVKWIDRSEKTTRSYLTNLKQFATWLRYMSIVNPTRGDVIAYREWLQSEHDAITADSASPSGWTYRLDRAGNRVRLTCKATTVRAYIHSVVQFFEWTEIAGLYPNVAKNIHAPKVTHSDEHLKDGLTPEEVLKIETHIKRQAELRQAEAKTESERKRRAEQDARLLSMYMLASCAGLRTIEISRANVKDVVVRGDTAILYVWGKGKSGPDTARPIAPEVYKEIKRYLDLRPDRPTGSSPLFVATGNRSGGKRLKSSAIGEILKKALVEAGFDSERITAHSLRHSAGTAVMRVTGHNLYKAQKYMRHQDPKTTEIYIHDFDDKVEQMVIAADVYRLYHNKEGAGASGDLMEKIERMTPDQLKQLNAIAATMFAS